MESIKSITIEDNEKYLRQISVPVDIENDKNLKDNIKILEKYCGENLVFAMAAVQLEIPKRVIYMRNTNYEQYTKWINNEITDEEEQNYNEGKILINPVITNRQGLTEYWEACASCLDNFGRVLRPYKIDLEYYDINGVKHIETFEGFESTVLSHEMDHLDGILHIDIAEEVLVMAAPERKIFRQSHTYNVISEIGDYEVLKKEERGKQK